MCVCVWECVCVCVGECVCVCVCVCVATSEQPMGPTMLFVERGVGVELERNKHGVHVRTRQNR